MNSNTKHRGHWVWRAMAALVATAQLLAPMGAVAQTASASTVIQSQASASYLDGDGVAQVSLPLSTPKHWVRAQRPFPPAPCWNLRV